jgi:PAS domain S-box-containing protein
MTSTTRPADAKAEPGRSRTTLAARIGAYISLQAASIGFIAVACLIPIAIYALDTWTSWTRAMAEARETTANLSRSIGQHAEDSFRAVDATMASLVDRIEAEGLDGETIGRLHGTLQREVAMLPQVQSLSVLDVHGTSIVTSLPVTGLNFADREYFQFHRTHGDDGVHVGTPVRAKATGQWVIPMTRRLNHRDGSFAGILLAPVDLAYFQRFYDTFQIGQQGSILLLSTDGVLLVRRPFNEALIGKSLAGGVIFNAFRNQTAGGIAEGTSATDGVARISSYRRLNSYPVLAAVALGRRDVLADWRSDAWQDALAALLMIAIIAGLGSRLARQIGLRAHAEHSAAEAASAYRLLADTSTDMIFRIDLDLVRRYVSPASSEILGYAPDELIGTRPVEQIHPDDAARVSSAFKDVIAGGERDTVTNRIRHRDGHWVWVEAQLRLVRDPATGAPVEVHGTMRDVSRRVAAEERLREANHRFEMMAANVPGIIYQRVRTPDGQYRYSFMSSGVKEVLGLDPEAVIADPASFASRIHPDDRARIAAVMEDSERTLSPAIADSRMIRTDGETIWCSAALRPTRQDDGSIVWDGFLGDISDRKRFEDALQAARTAADAANRAKSEFLATMSHEIRTPMNAVIGLTAMLSDSELDAEQRHHVKDLSAAARGLLALINDILDYSKIEAGQVKFDDADFPAATLIDGAVSVLSESARQKGLSVETSIAADVPAMLRGDQQRLSQILLNLVGNAIKFTERGRIAIRLACEANDGKTARLRFEIQDTGIGIPAELQGHLFSRFTQADSSITRRYGGSGLGLSICKRLVELMGGTIGVISARGEGSTFWFTAPLKIGDAAAIDRAPAAAPTDGRALRILVVDDAEMNRRIATYMLKSAGHTVDGADGGAAAVAAVRGADYDLVLMDLQMPDMDGYEATSRIRSLPAPANAVPVVAMTANVLPDDVARCYAAGMNGFVSKPIDKASLLQSVQRCSDTSARWTATAS